MPREFILFKQQDAIKACLVETRMAGCTGMVIAGNFYKSSEIYLGDFNHILDANRNLVGFEFPYWKINYEQLNEKPIVSETSSATIQSNDDLQLWLTLSHVGVSDLCQAIGNELFIGVEDVVIAIPEVTEWNVWRDIGFDCVSPQSVGFSFQK